MQNDNNNNNPTPSVSIIMPVYNTADFLCEAFDSILGQSFKDYELIVVNDGSTDHSASIIDSYLPKDNRIKVITQKNAGLSAARNSGISIAKGKYIYFFDSDDVLLDGALEKCYSTCENDNLDFCIFNISTIETVFSNNQLDRSSITDPTKVYEGQELIRLLLNNYAYFPTAWSSFVRRDFLLKYSPQFIRGIIHEDELYSFRLYLNAKRIKCLPEKLYGYRVRPESIMGKKFGGRNLNGYYATANAILQERETADAESQKTMDLYLSRTLDAMLWKAYVMPLKDKWKAVLYCFNHYRPYIRLKTYLSVLLKK